MTVSSELLLSVAHTAATGSGREVASLDNPPSQGADNSSAENAAKAFKAFLAQTTVAQSSGKQPSNTPATPIASEEADLIQGDQQNTVPEIIHNTDEEGLSGNIISEAILADPETSPAQIIEAGKTHNIISREIVENNVVQSDAAPSEKENTGTETAAAPEENNPEKLADEKPLTPARLHGQTPSPEEKISEQTLQIQEVKGTANAENNQQTSPPENINTSATDHPVPHGQAVREVAHADTPENHGQAVREIAQTDTPENHGQAVREIAHADTPENHGQAVREIAHADTPENHGQAVREIARTNAPVSPPAPENFQAEDATAQEETPPPVVSDETENADISPEFEGVSETPSQTSEDQNIPEAEEAIPQIILTQTDGDMIPAVDITAPQIDMVPTDVNKDPDQAAPLNPVSTPVTAEQQIVAAAVAPAPQKETDNSKTDKDSDKGNNISAARERNNAVPSDTAKTSSQNSSEDKSSATAAQSKASAAGPEQLRPAKVPFLTELSQSMIGAEGRTTGAGTLQLPTGLLVVQEVNPNRIQANGLTTPSQVNQPQPPVSPQMIARQISMAITKQVGDGQESFKISLKPAHLGQVDIRMDFQADGKIIATVTVENERTLTLLQKDQGSLEKALENAGFDSGGNSLNFSLKKQPQNHSEFANNNTEDKENDPMSSLPGSIVSHQQMKMAYSDNLLDINI